MYEVLLLLLLVSPFILAVYFCIYPTKEYLQIKKDAEKSRQRKARYWATKNKKRKLRGW